MIKECFLACALAMSPVYIGDSCDRKAAFSVFDLLQHGARQMGYLLSGPERVLTVREHEMLQIDTVRKQSKVIGRPFDAPFKAAVFTTVWHNTELPRADSFYPLVFQMARILKPGGFLMVEQNTLLDTILEQNNFYKMPFKIGMFHIYQLIQNMNSGRRIAERNYEKGFRRNAFAFSA